MMNAAIADSFHPIAFSTSVPSTSSQMAVLSLLSLWRIRSFSVAVPGGGCRRTRKAGIFPSLLSSWATFSGWATAVAEVRADASCHDGKSSQPIQGDGGHELRDALSRRAVDPDEFKLHRRTTAGKRQHRCVDGRSSCPSEST